jgi:hypothetical protein
MYSCLLQEAFNSATTEQRDTVVSGGAYFELTEINISLLVPNIYKTVENNREHGKQASCKSPCRY